MENETVVSGMSAANAIRYIKTKAEHIAHTADGIWIFFKDRSALFLEDSKLINMFFHLDDEFGTNGHVDPKDIIKVDDKDVNDDKE